MRQLTLLFTLFATLMAMAQAPLQSYKKSNANNPLNPFNFCADPTAVVYDGRVYVYGTNDHQEFSAYSPEWSETNSYGKINSLVCMSSSDMSNWTWHQPIDVKKAAPWTNCSWAPSICSKTDAEGNTKFYLYFANGASGIGVITADSPTGPWSDPLGRALVSPGQDQLGGIVWLFDPGVVVDDNGTGWLSYGGGDKPNSVGNDLLNGNPRLAKLTDDMIHFDGDPIVLPAPYHFEASELNYIGGKYVYTYCANWGPKKELWGEFEHYDHSKPKPSAPNAAQMCYMTSTDPLNPDSWQYVGAYLDHPGGNNHTHLQKFNDSYYLFYHSESYSRSMHNNDGKGYRSIGADKIAVNEEKCTIPHIQMSESGASTIRNNRPKATELHEAETIWNCAGIEVKFGRKNVNFVVPKEVGAWTAMRSVYANAEVKSISATLRGKGTLEVRLGDVNSASVAKIDFETASNSKFETFTVDLENPFKGSKTVYFVFTDINGTSVAFDSWQFNETEADAITTVKAAADVVSEEYYTVGGVKCQEPGEGTYIVKRRLSDGKTITEKVAMK